MIETNTKQERPSRKYNIALFFTLIMLFAEIASLTSHNKIPSVSLLTIQLFVSILALVTYWRSGMERSPISVKFPLALALILLSVI